MKTQKDTKKTWLACYLYYTSSPDALLVQKIMPLVQQVLQKKWAEQYFFIRYHDSRGPHIRLRFKGNTDILETQLKPLLIKIFPKSRFVAYQPELTRYSGKYGILLAEKLFEISSNTILSFLAEDAEQNYERSLGFALQLNLSMAYALGMDKTEAVAFFNHISSQGDEITFAKNLKEQKTAIFPFLSRLWTALDQQISFDKDWFNQWIQNVTIIGTEIQTAYRGKKLAPVDPQKTHQQNPLWYLYESYVHMNNNRLGIYNQDEPYMGYIISKALSYEK